MKKLFAVFLALTAGTASAQTMSGSDLHIESNSTSSFSVSSNAPGGMTTVDAKGPMQTEERHVGDFTSVEISAPVEMNYYATGTPALKISAPTDILPYIVTQVHDGKLLIKLKENTSLSFHDIIRVDVAGSSISSVVLSGSAKFNAAALNSPAFSAAVSESASVVASGAVKEVKLDVSGSGTVDTLGIHAKKISVKVSGSGNAKAFASGEADVDVSGAGSVTIAGSPHTRNVHDSEAGRTVFTQ